MSPRLRSIAKPPPAEIADAARSTSARSPDNRNMRKQQNGFTLLELLIVIAIIGLLAALTVPSIKNAQKSNALASTGQQLVDDIAMARRIAIKDRTTVLMVFLPPVNAADAGKFGPLNTGEKNVLLRGQQSAYAFYSLRQVGDQPGDPHPRYLRGWRYLPSGFLIPSWKFALRGPLTTIDATQSREQQVLNIPPFPWTAKPNIPVPSLKTPRQVKISLPYIAFGPSGGLQQQDETTLEFVDSPNDEYVPISQASVFLARDPNDDKTLTWEPANISERPANNSIDNYNVIIIDKLTGRTRVAKPEIRP